MSSQLVYEVNKSIRDFNEYIVKFNTFKDKLKGVWEGNSLCGIKFKSYENNSIIFEALGSEFSLDFRVVSNKTSSLQGEFSCYHYPYGIRDKKSRNLILIRYSDRLGNVRSELIDSTAIEFLADEGYPETLSYEIMKAVLISEVVQPAN